MSETPFTIFMSLRTESAWLALSREHRQDFLGQTVRPLLARYPQVGLCYYDAEAFTGRFTDPVPGPALFRGGRHRARCGEGLPGL